MKRPEITTSADRARSLGAAGMRRAMARILDELNTIKEEGTAIDGSPTWYALDRFAQIAETAKLAAEGKRPRVRWRARTRRHRCRTGVF